MAGTISLSHPLGRLFSALTERNFIQKLGLADMDIISYISRFLIDFTHIDNLYRIKNVKGKPLDEVGEMLLESNPLLQGSSFIRERQVRKHIGDYTLFFTGIFPESLKRMRRSPRLDYFLDYIKAGKESYRIVAEYDYGPYQQTAPLFRKLAHLFDFCVVGLNFVRADLDSIRHQYYRKVKHLFS